MELDTSMTGLEPGDEIRFQPGPCVVTEIQRSSPGHSSRFWKRTVSPDEVDDWIEEKGRFSRQSTDSATVRWIFACTIATAVPQDETTVSSGDTLQLALSKDTFTKITQRYNFSTQILDAWRYRASSGSGARLVDYDDATGDIKSISFVIAIRLSGSFASVIAINHDLSTNGTNVLALRVDPYDQGLLQKSLELHQDLVGHPLLVPTILVEISLATNLSYMQKIRHELSVIEKATGQHGWLQIPVTDAPAHDSELSRLGHSCKLHVSVSRRRIESIKCWVQLIKQTLTDYEATINRSSTSIPILKNAYGQWISNIDLMIGFRQVDLGYSERRADNQITAIYGLLTQRDNMVGVSVAIESKKISEASKRDGSALKSLTVLTAIFFPATYIASLFSLPTFDASPFWLYWVVTIPLTLIIFGFWSGWTLYRQRRIAQETVRRKIIRDVDIDPERAFPSADGDPSSSSLLISTLRQIRSQTRHLHHPTSSSQAPLNEVKEGISISERRGG